MKPSVELYNPDDGEIDSLCKNEHSESYNIIQSWPHTIFRYFTLQCHGLLQIIVRITVDCPKSTLREGYYACTMCR
jgi:hypothetical protein